MMKKPPSVSYVVAVHNEAGILRDTVACLIDRLESLPDSEIVLVENGSTDSSREVADDLSEANLPGPVDIRVEVSAKGLGHALRKGMSVASSELVVLTAADLPFGFSDLDAALLLEPMPRLVLGSKAHPDSLSRAPVSRRIMSRGYRWLREVLLDLDYGDTQGSILLARSLAQELLPTLRSGDYLIGTEIVALAERAGERAVEVPVDYRDVRSDSKVRPFRDSLKMLAGLLRLRRRLVARTPIVNAAERPAPADCVKPVQFVYSSLREFGGPEGIAGAGAALAALTLGLVGAGLVMAVIAVAAKAANSLRARTALFAARPMAAVVVVAIVGVGVSALVILGLQRRRRGQRT